MKAAYILPAVLLISACSSQVRHGASEQIVVTEGEDGALVTTSGSQMMVSDRIRFGDSDYATYTEHDVDTETGTLRGSRHFVMVDGEALDCADASCEGALASYYNLPTERVSTMGSDSYIVR